MIPVCQNTKGIARPLKSRNVLQNKPRSRKKLWPCQSCCRAAGKGTVFRFQEKRGRRAEATQERARERREQRERRESERREEGGRALRGDERRLTCFRWKAG